MFHDSDSQNWKILGDFFLFVCLVWFWVLERTGGKRRGEMLPS